MFSEKFNILSTVKVLIVCCLLPTVKIVIVLFSGLPALYQFIKIMFFLVHF